MPVPERQSDLKPFPTNPEFRSQSVLDEDLREEIYKRVADQEKSVKVVSAELGVEMSRIGAVVRLKAVERSWIKNNRTLAKPYANAILAMLPKTQYVPNQPRPHESINDLIVHPATTQQIFHPTSESRAFTRADAGRVFDPQLLPADERIPHPELIELERERLEGVKREDRIQRQRERTQRELRLKVEKQERMRQREKKMVHKVLPASQGGAGGRWLWRFQQINVHDAGKDGRGSKGVGWRYGLPHEDRKPGQIKIPTRA
ncbi:MAG: hypothetical protein M1817_000858 [Caeruleum heppii]|nr:MAG: hypothetical protein M1817_000858 [Caeruleum heppii]